jgi:ABC-type transport system involved in multi-copper enzyme maturation permease subunit
MNRLLAIASNTFRETIRDKILYSIIFFACIVILGSVAMEEITIGDQDKVVRSMAQGAIRLFGSVIALFLGVGLVYKELERKTIYTIASKPIPRWIFILGKYTGLLWVLALELGLMALLYTAMMWSRQGAPHASVYVSWIMLYMELGLLTAWAMLFSCYSAPTTAALFSISVWAIGHMADDIWLFGQEAASETIRTASEVIYWILPNFEMFNASAAAVHELPLTLSHFGGVALYGLGYTAVVIAGAVMVFSRRDFK